MFVRMYHPDADGGNAPGVANEVVNVPGAPSGRNPFELDGKGLEELDRDLNGPRTDEPKPEVEKPQLGQFDEQGNPIEEAPVELPVDEYTEEELLAELELDNYQSVRDALLAHKELNSKYTQEHQVLSRLEQTAQRLGLPVDDLIKSLEGLDPRTQAQNNSPAFQNFERFLQENSQTEYHPFYKNMAQALTEDIKTQVIGGFGRFLQSLENQMNEYRLDFEMDKFMRATDREGNPVNKDWHGRESELKQALNENPNWKGKPNQFDLAKRFIIAGKEPVRAEKKVNEQAKKLLQEIQRKRTLKAVETPGRTLNPVKTDGPVGPDGLTSKQREAVIDDADRKGLRLV